MFRVKIALLSVLIPGSVLVGLGFYSLSVMNKVGIARIDREILTLGEGHLAVRPPRDYWQSFGSSLQFIYGEERSKNLIVQIKDQRNEVLFKSPRWPAEITESSFPDFDRAMDARPPVPYDRDIGPGPPPEAYKACEGKSAGMVAEFTDPRGEILKGTCEEENGKLVLRPYSNRDGNARQFRDGPGDRSPRSPPSKSDQPGGPVPRIKKKPSFASIETPRGIWRTGIMGSDRITMIVGVNMASFHEDAAAYRRAFLATVPIALILLAGGGWVIARGALKPISLITRTAEGITVRALNQRVPLVNGNSELSRLVEVINGMLDRLEKSFTQAIRFSADAAHELQTPLTVLQGELDDAVQRAPVGSEEQQHYSSLLEEVQQLKVIVQKLLILARADAGRLELRDEAIDLSLMIESVAEDTGAMAPHLRIEEEMVPGVVVNGDPDLLGQAIRNLTSNAVKYNHEKGLVRFQLSVRDNKAHFTISNTGAPIPPKDRERIFDRFYRVDQSRSRKVPGSGLGLSLAREIVRAHRGDLRLDPDSGYMVSFTLSLPCITS